MLYASTRDERDAFTAARTLAGDFAADGGLFVPFRLPRYSWQEIADLSNQSFGQIIAQLLNMFFSVKLTGWDVDFSIGRAPVKLVWMNHRLIVAELWHNPGTSYQYLVDRLYERIRITGAKNTATDWAKVAVRISVLFGVISILIKEKYAGPGKPVDIAVSADDFSLPTAAWYARKMGLPIGMITCGCNINSGLWDLLRRGEYTSVGVPVEIRAGHERLIHETLGTAEARRYGQRCELGKVFSVSEEALPKLNNGFFAAVVGEGRVASLISSVHKSGGYRLSREDALAYGALQDYRAGIAEGRSSLMLADNKPDQLK